MAAYLFFYICIKNNPVKFPLLAFLGACLLFTACSHAVLQLDNPTDKKISFLLDGEEEQLAAFENRKIEVPTGTHTLKLAILKIDTTFQTIENTEYLINPSKSWYVKEALSYAKSNVPVKELEEHAIFIKGIEVVGAYKKMGGILVLKKDWDFDVTEAIPDSVKGSQGKAIRYKLYREKDLVKMLVNNFLGIKVKK